MISQARSRGICQACRHDLQSLFERGFCNNPSPSKTRPQRLRQLLRSRHASRPFSCGTRSLTSSYEHRNGSAYLDKGHQLAQQDRIRATQEAAIEQLVDALEKSPDEAIEEDESVADLTNTSENNINTTQSGTQNVDLLTSLRDAGAASADVARQARQIHGDTLPDGLLSEDELVQYRRFYGEPLKETETSQLDQDQGVDQDGVVQSQLLSADGEEIDFRPYSQGIDNLSSSRSSTALTKARAKDLAESLGGTVLEGDEAEDFEEDEDFEDFEESERGHPLTMMGKFRTSPKTVFLSQDGFIKPVERTMSKFSNKHLKEMCERTFGGPGLPDSPLTPRSGRGRQQVPIPLDVNQNHMGEMEANAFVTSVMPPTYASIQSVLSETRKRLGSSWLSKLLAREGGPRILDAGAGGAGIIAWRDVVEAHWQSLHTSDKEIPPPPPSKSVVVTGSDGLRHRAAEMLENTTFVPRLPDYVHTRDMPTIDDHRPTQQRKRFDVIIAPHTLFGLKEDWMRKQYVQNLWMMLSEKGGVLILIEKGVSRGFEAIAGAREMLLDRYIAVPKGHTTHYSKNHDQDIDEDSIHKKETAMIVAPCTNHEKCPMYTAPGLSRGRKDICSFQQRYIRPPFLQRVLGAKDRNHDDVEFSYLAVMKGDDLRLRDITTWDQLSNPLSAPLHPNPFELGQSHVNLIRESNDGFESVLPAENETLEPHTPLSTNTNQLPTFQQMPRIVFQPLKRRGHVSIDLCTPAGKIERWTIPRSFSKQAYRDARKSKWGDLWALGAKTHIARSLKLGTPEKDLFGKDGELIKGRARGRKDRLKIKAQQMLEQHEEERMDNLMEQRDLMAALDEELTTDPGTPRDFEPSNVSSTRGKPLNNRERKAAKKASLAATQAPESSNADLTFKPQLPTRSIDTDDSMMDELALEHAMSEWQAEYDQAGLIGKGKKGGAYAKFGSSTKAAKNLQRGRDRKFGQVSR